ncbi:MAG: hypothetical protein ABII18_13580, partial [bacterium]
MSTVTYDYQDTTIETIQDYFGESVTAEDLMDMNETEREAYFEALYAAHELSSTELSEFEDALEDELENIHDTLYTYHKQLEDMIESGNLTAAEEANCELMMEDLQEWMEMLDDNGEIMSDWGDAITNYTEKNVALEEGDSYTVNPTDPQDGDMYTVTVNESDDSGSSMWNTEENANWIDTTGDTFYDTNPDQYDVNGNLGADGIADEDFDGMNGITEADMTYGHNTTTAQVTISLEEGDTYAITSYDANSNTAMIKVTQEDGTFYYIQLIMTGDTKILVKQQPTNDLNTVNTELLSMMYENTTTDRSFYQHVYNTPYDDGTVNNYYSIYDMSTYEDNTHIITPTPADYENSRAYTVNFESDEADNLTLNFPDGADISFSLDPDGNIVMTVSTEDGEITITLVGLETSTDDTLKDMITINGDVDISIDDDLYNTFYNYGVPVPDLNGLQCFGGLFTMIYLSEDEDTIDERFQDEGYSTMAWYPL